MSFKSIRMDPRLRGGDLFRPSLDRSLVHEIAVAGDPELAE
jgi:hypothetical protein